MERCNMERRKQVRHSTTRSEARSVHSQVATERPYLIAECLCRLPLHWQMWNVTCALYVRIYDSAGTLTVNERIGLCGRDYYRADSVADTDQTSVE